MKTKSFTLNNKELLLVELPNSPVVNIVPRNHKYKDFIMHFQDGDLFHFQPDGECDVLGKLPDGNWQLIGKLPEVTEEQYSKIVAKNYWDMGTGGYVDYASEDPSDNFLFAKESFFSKLESEGILFKNPFGSHPDNWTYTTEAMHMKNPDIKAWQSAQEKVFNIGNTFLFERV